MTEPTQHTDAQISLRTILVWMTGLGVLSAIAAPFVRRLDSPQQFRLLTFCAVVGVILLAVLVLSFLRRRHLEKISGNLLLRTQRTGSVKHLILKVVIPVGLLLWIVYLATEFVEDSQTTKWLPALGPLLQVAMLSSISVTYLVLGFEGNTIEAREHGLIFGGQQLFPWYEIKSHRWGGPSPSQLTLQLHQRVVNILVNPADRQALDEILTAHLGGTAAAES